jgi:HEAT repeat protein
MEVGVAALLKGLNHPKTNVRSQSSMILILVHRDQNKKLPKAVIDGLVLALSNEKDGEVRAIVAKAIGGSKDTRFHSALVTALKNDSYPAVKRNAAKAVGLRRVRAGIDPLIAGLSHKDTRVRMECATALRKLKARKAVGPLVGLLTDSNSMVRDRAHKALKTITGKRLPADPKAWVRYVR